MSIRRLVVTSMLAGLLAALTACGGTPATTPSTSNQGNAAPSAAAAASSAAAPATAGELPLYPNVSEIQSGTPMATALDMIKQQLAQQQEGSNVTVDAYTLPDDTSFEQVRTFYEQELTASGWKAIEIPQETASAMQGGGTAAWTKDDAEVLTIFTMADPTQSGTSFLLVAHGGK